MKMEEKTLEKRIEQLEAREKVITEAMKATLTAVEITERSRQEDFNMLLSIIESRVNLEFDKHSWNWWLYLVIIPVIIAFSVSCLIKFH